METGKYFLISHLALITGLSDRTIRNYISKGLIQGEMINGMWHFTPEQVAEFVRHPAVRPSIQAKQNAIVYDFLLQDKRSSSGCCVILDLTESGEAQRAQRFFCERISEGDYTDINFSFDGVAKTPRVILEGATAQVIELVNEFYGER